MTSPVKSLKKSPERRSICPDTAPTRPSRMPPISPQTRRTRSKGRKTEPKVHDFVFGLALPIA